MERRILCHLPCKVPVSASLLDTITTAFLVTDRKWSFGRVMFSQQTVCPHASWDRSHYRVPPMDIRSGDLPHPLGHQTWAPIPSPPLVRSGVDQSLETCSNLFIWGPTLPQDRHLVVATETYGFQASYWNAVCQTNSKLFETQDFHHSYPILKWTRICQISQKQKWPPV